jgi:hypothetical protein
VIELYKRLARGCNSINQLNEIHVSFEKRITPLELTTLRSELTALARRGRFTQKVNRLLKPAIKNVWGNEAIPLVGPSAGPNTLNSSKAWIDKLHRKFTLAGKKPPEPFMRRRLLHGVWTFESGRDLRQKTLLICFSGNAQRLMLPTPVFLQHIDAQTTDVVYLRTEKHCGYRKGILGVAGELDASIAALECLLRVREYRRVATIGTSGGALPAILAGLQLSVDAVLSIGPNNPNDVRWTEFTKGGGAPDLFRRFADASKRVPNVHLVHGADSEKDAASVEAIASCIQVHGITSVPNARHNALYPLVTRGQFRHLLMSTLFGGRTSPGLGQAQE